MANSTKSVLALSALCVLLSACGGSDSGVASAPPPPPPAPPPPPPPPSGNSAVTLLADPATQEFAAVGSGDLLRIRYDAVTKLYEVKAGSTDWDRLVDDTDILGPGVPNKTFTFASNRTQNGSYFIAQAHPNSPSPESNYQFSNLAFWQRVSDGLSGVVAFGVTTAPGGVPVTGSGSYQGLILGTSTVDTIDWDGNPVSEGIVSGAVTLNFDFQRAALAGQMVAIIDDHFTEVQLPAFTFTDTVVSATNSSYSGRFVTDATGINSFSGLFTGPHGEELIGSWTIPFLYKGLPESATGAWIAKRGD